MELYKGSDGTEQLRLSALPVPEITAIGALGGGCEPPILGKRRPQRSGMVPFERALVSSCRPSMHSKFSSIFTRFRDIAAFVLGHATFPH